MRTLAGLARGVRGAAPAFQLAIGRRVPCGLANGVFIGYANEYIWIHNVTWLENAVRLALLDEHDSVPGRMKATRAPDA